MSTIERVRSGELSAHVGERAWVMGWLHSRRALGGLTFLVVRDGWGLVQAVLVEERMAALDGVMPESILELEGTVVSDPQIELHGQLDGFAEFGGGFLMLSL